MQRKRRTSALVPVLILLLALPRYASGDQTPAPADVWRAFAEKIEPGKVLKVRLVSGKRFKATLLQASADAMTVQARTRVPVPPQQVPFTEIASIEIDTGKGANVAKAIAIGAASAAGTFFGLLLLAFAMLGD